MDHQTGARCLRYVIEDTLLDVMYDLPSLPEVARCVVDRDAIEGETVPALISDSGDPLTVAAAPRKKSA